MNCMRFEIHMTQCQKTTTPVKKVEFFGFYFLIFFKNRCFLADRNFFQGIVVKLLFLAYFTNRFFKNRGVLLPMDHRIYINQYFYKIIITKSLFFSTFF